MKSPNAGREKRLPYLAALRRYGFFGQSVSRALQVILATHVTFPMPRVRDGAGFDRHRMIRFGRSQHTQRSVEVSVLSLATLWRLFWGPLVGSVPR